MRPISIEGRAIGPDSPPFVIAEIGINHEGSLEKAMAMVDAAADAGCECVKFQCHVMEDEMTQAARHVVPANAQESIWDIMSRCALDEEADRILMRACRERGLIYLSTPFSRAAADRLEKMGVPAYKIGSGECNNTPLVEHISSFGKPVLLSTGMNDLASVERTVSILDAAYVPYAVLHCTSMYPTPYEKVRLGVFEELRQVLDVPVGLSDHSLGIWTCLGAVALGASIVEKHFTISNEWPGPDVPISIDPKELSQLIVGSRAIWEARGGSKTVLDEEQPTIAFAYASVCTTRAIRAGEVFSRENLWVRRPGTGGVLAARYAETLGRKAARDIEGGVTLAEEDIV